MKIFQNNLYFKVFYNILGNPINKKMRKNMKLYIKFFLIVNLSLLSLKLQANMEIKDLLFSIEVVDNYETYTLSFSHLAPTDKNDKPICQIHLKERPDIFSIFDYSNVFSRIDPNVFSGYAPDAPTEYKPPLFAGIELSSDNIPIPQTPYCSEEQSEMIKWALLDSELVKRQDAVIPTMGKSTIEKVGRNVSIIGGCVAGLDIGISGDFNINDRPSGVSAHILVLTGMLTETAASPLHTLFNRGTVIGIFGGLTFCGGISYGYTHLTE